MRLKAARIWSTGIQWDATRLPGSYTFCVDGDASMYEQGALFSSGEPRASSLWPAYVDSPQPTASSSICCEHLYVRYLSLIFRFVCLNWYLVLGLWILCDDQVRWCNVLMHRIVVTYCIFPVWYKGVSDEKTQCILFCAVKEPGNSTSSLCLKLIN